MIKLKIEGLGKVQRRFEQLKRNAERLDGAKIPARELFTPEFMMRCSSFKSFDEMLHAGPTPAQSSSDLNNPEWDAHVRNSTTFPSWEAMKKAAAAEWGKRNLLR